MNKESMFETTTKFAKLKKELDEMYYGESVHIEGNKTYERMTALKCTIDNLLDLLDELVREL